MVELYRIYMDDSGNVDAATTNTPETRYGSITAVIMGAHYLDNRFNASFAELSKRHFGLKDDGTAHNIHRRLIAKPPEKGPFSVLRKKEKREAWDAAALKMFGKAEYTVITAVIDKVAWYYQFPDWRGDFYEVLVQAALERAWYFLKNRDLCAEFYIEHKNDDKNDRIKAAYRKAMTDGFQHIKSERLRKHYTSIEPNILRKEDCRPGMQLADLIAGPAMHHVRHLHTGKHPISGQFTRSLTEILGAEEVLPRGQGTGRLWPDVAAKNLKRPLVQGPSKVNLVPPPANSRSLRIISRVADSFESHKRGGAPFTVYVKPSCFRYPTRVVCAFR